MKTTDQFDDYLFNRLEENERLNFEKELSENKQLADEFDLHKKMHSLINEYEDEKLRKKLKASSIRQFGSAKVRTLTVAALSIAASFVIIFNLWINNTDSVNPILSDNTQSVSYLDKYFEAPVNYLMPETRGDTNKSELARALSYYDKKEYQKSVDIFNTILLAETDDRVKFYAGAAFLLNKDTARAKQLFEEVEKEEGYFTDAIVFYLGLIYLDEQQEKKGVTQMQKVKDGKSKFKKDAEAILDSIAIKE